MHVYRACRISSQRERSFLFTWLPHRMASSRSLSLSLAPSPPLRMRRMCSRHAAWVCIAPSVFPIRHQTETQRMRGALHKHKRAAVAQLDIEHSPYVRQSDFPIQLIKGSSRMWTCIYFIFSVERCLCAFSGARQYRVLLYRIRLDESKCENVHRSERVSTKQTTKNIRFSFRFEVFTYSFSYSFEFFCSLR